MIVKLESDRLHMRIVSNADLAHVHELNSLPETDKFNTLGIPRDADETKLVIQGWLAEYRSKPIKAYTFIVEQKNTRQFIGMIGIRLGKPAFRIAEVWYKLHSREWGNGYATEALERIIEFGFVDLLLHRIEAGCATENTASAKVMEKAGMKREGMRRKALPLKTGWADNYIYGILESD